MTDDKSGSQAPSEPPQQILDQALAVAAGNDDASGQPVSNAAQAHDRAARLAQPPSHGHAAAVQTEASAELAPPPAYGDRLNSLDLTESGFDTHAKVGDDGRVDININQKSTAFSSLLGPALQKQLRPEKDQAPPSPPPGYIPSFLGGEPGRPPPPPLNVVIQVVGSRGDVQPFVALGQILKKTYGHRVRLATHPTFQNFVEENGLEFFNISGDPSELMAFMVKNPGLMPGMDAMKSGDVRKRRKGIYEILKGCWRSCIEAGDGTGPKATDETVEDYESLDSAVSLSGDPTAKPFVADAIIANPPSFAHIHVAEKLGIPLHMMFTMPWSPTQAFPHPLANIQSSNADNAMTNFVSYALVEMMTWQGLGDLINRFRERTLGLESISLIWAPGMIARLRIPFTYCWSPALIPKPKDWSANISIVGFYFLSLASSYAPEPDLDEFLKAGPPPVYIGFGSIVVDDPEALTKLIFEAVEKSGVRALVSKGWGGFGADQLRVPENVFMLGNVPHDWLFKRVSCVVHHGGAGTTAAGMALGKPTVIVPFFGDQPFWGAMIAKAGAGPPPLAYKELTAEKLAEAITEALKPAALEKAADLGARIGEEEGAEDGAKSFHEQLDIDGLRCTLSPSRAAVWRVKRTQVRLSALAASVLGNEGLLDFGDLKLYRSREYITDEAPWDPITGGASALIGTIGALMMGVADVPLEFYKALSGNKNSKKKQTDENASSQSRASSGLQSRSTTDVAGPSDPSSRSSTSLTGANNVSSPDDIAEQGRPGLLSPTPSFGSDVNRRDLSRRTDENSNPSSRTYTSSSSKSASRSHSRQASGDRSATPTGSKLDSQQAPGEVMTLEKALNAGTGMGRFFEAGLKSPMDFTLALARGFHNAPKLYGDKTVRPEDKVTGFQSGLKAAGREFGFGFYDGISGMVTQPIKGAKKEGASGLIKGIGKGIGGIVLKPGAAIWALPGYTYKGIYKELQKHWGASVQNYIIAARTAQGYEDWKSSTVEERADIITRWRKIQDDVAKSRKTVGDKACDSLSQFNAKYSFPTKDQRSRARDKENAKPPHQRIRTNEPSPGPVPRSLEQPSSTTPPQDTQREQSEFEEAIRRSVAQTSTGDAEQDTLIEQAIRESVDEYMKARSKSVPQEQQPEKSVGSSAAQHDNDLLGQESGTIEMTSNENASSKKHMGEKAKTHEAGTQSTNTGYDQNEEEMIRQAIEASKQAHTDQERIKSEEEIVLEHIKRQSLAEEEHYNRLQKGKTPSDDHDGDNDDEDMKRAIAESLSSQRKGNGQGPSNDTG